MTAGEIAALVAPYTADGPVIRDEVYESLAAYLALLEKWNARTNLTAVRESAEMVRRHFGESLFAARAVPVGTTTLLDFGSGAGFPGLPLQLVYPEVRVTLAESQNKKATFLREVVRTLGLKTEIWAGRVESMPWDRRFDVVTLRAVDDMDRAVRAAAERVGDRMVVLTSGRQKVAELEGMDEGSRILMPGEAEQEIRVFVRR